MQCARTPVTVRCDFPECPETEWMLTVTTDRPDDIADVRRRAAAAMLEVATSRGWRVNIETGAALCPHHAGPGLVVIL